MSLVFLQSRSFWQWFFVSGALCVLLFLWLLNLLPFVPVLPRPEPMMFEYVYSITSVVLLSFNLGLLAWRMRHGSCPVGTRRVTGFAGLLATITLICPVCLVLPLSVLGISISLVFLAPFLPLLQLISMVLLLGTAVMLWPR